MKVECGGANLQGKNGVMNCGAYRGMKLLKNAMKMVERVLERQIRALVNLDKMQFGFMPGRKTIHALYILRRKQEDY